METIGSQKIWSYFGDDGESARPASNQAIRAGAGHQVDTFFKLAIKVAELQFLNRDHVLLFRGQSRDHKSIKKNSTLKATLFRLNGLKLPIASVLAERFDTLRKAEDGLIARYTAAKFLGHERLQRHRILRWAILQHYEVCATPLLDVTQSLKVAASFACQECPFPDAFLFVFGVPNLSGAVTASSEANLQIVRLSSACPPDAARPHLQEGFLLGEYPEISDYRQNSRYSYYEMDFGRRLIAKFRFSPTGLWSENFQPTPVQALYPEEKRDRLLPLMNDLKTSLHTYAA